MNPDTDPGSSISSELGSGSGSRVLMTTNWIQVIKNFNLLIPKPPRYRRSLQLSKENIQDFKKWNLLTFYIFVAHSCPLGSGSRGGDPIESGSWSTTLTTLVIRVADCYSLYKYWSCYTIRHFLGKSVNASVTARIRRVKITFFCQTYNWSKKNKSVQFCTLSLNN